MVLRQIREDRGRERNAVDAPRSSACEADLDRASTIPAICHRRVRRAVRSPPALFACGSAPHRRRSIRQCRSARRAVDGLEYLPHQVSNRRLPVGALSRCTSSARLGSSKNRRAIAGIAARASSTDQLKARRDRSGARKPAPPRHATTASAAKSWPSLVKPATQKKSVPGPASRLEYARSDLPSPQARSLRSVAQVHRYAAYLAAVAD